MASDILSYLFVSYSHADKPYMLTFRKHLQGMLLDKVKVWSDEDIPKGAEWESLLNGNLHQAASALVLATPDYLVSTWCRHELKQLAAAWRLRRLHNVFWVQLKPCGWQQTELAEFQSFESSVERAITELPDEGQRQRAILEICERIASEVARAPTKDDRLLAWVRGLLLDAPDIHDISVSKVLHRGSFSIVCKGVSGSINVAVKVFRRTPLEKMAIDFLRIGEERRKLSGPTFVRIHNIFQAGPEEERRTVIVSDYVDEDSQLSKRLEKGNPIPVDATAQLLRRAAEGLRELHSAGSKDSSPQWHWTLGLLIPTDVYFDEPANRLRVAPIGASSFLWHVLDCVTYAAWVDKKSKVYIAPEQRKSAGEELTPKTDQYMLARLGVEMLEGKHFEQILGERSATLENFNRDPGDFLKQCPWARNHGQLCSVLTTMLQEDPSNRYQDMHEAVLRLDALEEETRALAKRVYLGPSDAHIPKLKDNAGFFKEFYDRFFKESEESEELFEGLDREKQHEKLMMSMVAVLNFRQGNEPTSLTDIVEKHKKLKRKITRREFEIFQESFVETLKEFKQGGPEIAAWKSLLQPVTEYMISKCVGPGDGPQGSVGGRADALDGKA